MQVLIAIALKSLLISGLALGLLALLRHRSAAERSWVAHVGLLALVVMALAPLVLPNWNVAAPALFSPAPVAEPVAGTAPATTAVAPLPASVAPTRLTAAPISISPLAATTAAYALPAAVLLVITFLALMRLVALRARADVLVDGHWLSALARAQRRMGFKHGTALLTSDDLASPISWGLMRPVILLNSRAVEAAGDAEAIIAHELAHVARLDWIKLLLARVATALFWFNPLVWVLAREAHQLREEAADDSVLAADIADTDYAQLLVGVARHECPGLLLGAHGVAPSKGSLARRVARVLDGKTARGPVARSFALGVFAGALLVAAPLAALTLTPGAEETSKSSRPSPAVATGVDMGKPYYSSAEPPADLPHIIAHGVATSVATAVAAVSPSEVELDAAEIAQERAQAARDLAVEQAQLAAERAREVGREMRKVGKSLRESRAGELQAIGVTPEYVGAMRASAPRLARLEPSEFAGMRAVGVTPEFARELMAAMPGMSPDELVEARAVGVTGAYVRQMRAAGVRGDIDDFVQLRAVGVEPSFVQRARKAGFTTLDPDELVELRALGRVGAPPPPRAPPGGWRGDPPPGASDEDDDGG
jgi:beta-lactamase regulating signal transducer with metallopeptidase domain